MYLLGEGGFRKARTMGALSRRRACPRRALERTVVALVGVNTHVLMSETGASATRREVDRGRKYGIMLNNNSNSWKCIFCKKDFNAGISRLKQHLRGDHRNAKACTLCPPHVREALIKHKQMKEDEIAARNLALQEEEEGLDEYDEECGKESQPRRLVPNTETQDKIMTELDAFKDATGIFGHDMAIRQRDIKAPGKGIASSNQKQSSAPAMRLVDEEDELEEDLDEDDLGYEDVEYDDEDDNNGVSEDDF
ncbi:hypothetical protein F2Q69_00024670 [Brassica cretica]|uniref:BED-type domain-containing protein n=1 Tax=Brassica cretica TaxID=69181 RepID=A0A8S9QE51_BRACR|nr:hypothetical protein F2Q69_00024670 [Brassica cretica]